jgi:hypothetical protein
MNLIGTPAGSQKQNTNRGGSSHPHPIVNPIDAIAGFVHTTDSRLLYVSPPLFITRIQAFAKPSVHFS